MFSTEKRMIIFVVISCLLLALLGYAWKQRTTIPYVSSPLQTVTTPFAYGANKVVDGIVGSISLLKDSISAKQRIKDLEQEREALLEAKVNYDEVLAENVRLRQLLRFETTHPQFEVRAAMIITRDYGSWTNTFVIDRGLEEGVKANMAVVAAGGVVGFVSEAFPHSARVQTLLDPRSAVGAIVQRPESRLVSIVQGNGNNQSEPQMVNIANEGDVLVGDTIVTSGYGGIFPKGLLIGHVLELKPDQEGFVKHAVLKPSVDFNNLEEVLVITQSYEAKPEARRLDPKLVPQTQRDQVEGAKGAVKE